MCVFVCAFLSMNFYVRPCVTRMAFRFHYHYGYEHSEHMCVCVCEKASSSLRQQEKTNTNLSVYNYTTNIKHFVLTRTTNEHFIAIYNHRLAHLISYSPDLFKCVLGQKKCFFFLLFHGYTCTTFFFFFFSLYGIFSIAGDAKLSSNEF